MSLQLVDMHHRGRSSSDNLRSLKTSVATNHPRGGRNNSHYSHHQESKVADQPSRIKLCWFWWNGDCRMRD
jgi:hypothetical protein